jgi:hypothetical protein
MFHWINTALKESWRQQIIASVVMQEAMNVTKQIKKIWLLSAAPANPLSSKMETNSFPSWGSCT